MGYNEELLIPEAAKRDPNSFELLRVWVAENKQHVSLRGCTWDDPAAWGIMLADLAKHIANSYEPDDDFNWTVTLQRIKVAFETEINYPTDLPSGDLTT